LVNVSTPSVAIPHTLADRLVSELTILPGEHAPIIVAAPATGAAIGTIPACAAPDVEQAIARAREAQPAWAALPFSARAGIFLRFHDRLLDRQNEVLDLIQLETGKARRHAFEEVLDAAVVSRYYARHAKSILRKRWRRGALPGLTTTWEIRCPVGVVGFISPWNFPLVLGITDAIAALMAGNAAVLKPDPQASFTALWAVRLLRECGLPRDVLSIVTGEGPVLGPALIDRVDYVMFTGSAHTGKLVAKQAAERLIGCSLELGGKNPMLVLADAGLDAAVEGAVRGCFPGAGQVCISIERIFVHEAVYEAFLRKLAERTGGLRLGVSGDYSMDVGSLTTERQLRAVDEHVRDAVAKGATVVAGGRARPDLGPLFYEPTVLTGVTPDMRLYAEETFGPVVAVYPFKDETEAVRHANETDYGLSASIWTRDTARGVALARQIRAGSVNVNEAYAAAWGSVDSPVGGMKQSGLRPRHGAEGILKFTESQTVAVERLLPIAPSHGMTPEFWSRWMTRLLRVVRYIRILG
jgi:succinate-semialdehyde dehydrogenase / glutarate-semialdehyde dehydrogenase